MNRAAQTTGMGRAGANAAPPGPTTDELAGLATGILFNTTGTGARSILTIGAGLTLTGSTLTNDLLSGKAGGQTVVGGVAAGENLTLSSTSHATKGTLTATSGSQMILNTTSANLRSPASDGTSGTAGCWISVADSGLTLGTSNVSISLDRNNSQIAISGNIFLTDARNIALGSGSGNKIGTATSQKLGFWNTAPVAQQVLATGAGKVVDDVIALLQTIGLCRQA
ncbi:MAG: hypothetical protein ACJ8GN_02130 [Longimicrobiaceae bacterium]